MKIKITIRTGKSEKKPRRKQLQDFDPREVRDEASTPHLADGERAIEPALYSEPGGDVRKLGF